MLRTEKTRLVRCMCIVHLSFKKASEIEHVDVNVSELVSQNGANRVVKTADKNHHLVMVHFTQLWSF